MLQYLAQYVEPPEALRTIEMLTPGRLLHMPGKPFSRAMIAHAPSFFKLEVGLPTANCWSALARASSITFASLAQEAKDLEAVAEQHVPAIRFLRGIWSPSFWNTPCILARTTGPGEPTLANADASGLVHAQHAALNARPELREKAQKCAKLAWI